MARVERGEIKVEDANQDPREDNPQQYAFVGFIEGHLNRRSLGIAFGDFYPRVVVLYQRLAKFEAESESKRFTEEVADLQQKLLYGGF